MNLARLAFFALLGWTLAVLRGSGESVDATPAGRVSAARAGLLPLRRRTRSRRRRLASSLAFATLFFAGAALSAGAGDMIVGAVDENGATTTETTATEDDPSEDADAAASEEATPEEGAAPEDGPAEIPTPGTDEPAAGGGANTPAGGTSADAPAAPKTTGGGSHSSPGAAPTGATPAPTAPAQIRSGPPLITPSEHADDDDLRGLEPEASEFGASTVWLHRTLPDPTPPARRLAPAFARMLRAEAGRTGAGWATILAALRADGNGGRRPADRAHLHAIATKLAASKAKGEWLSFLALRGKTAWADEAQALARYNRAVGLRALVTGLDAAKPRLARRLLADNRVTIYPGGRTDLAAGRIDVRVIVLIRYLAEAHGQVTVSSLTSGHRLYARPGVVSAHVYGLAVDIAALDNRSIYGNQQPGGITEQAVRNILLLPAEISPRQVISLLGLGGPSFPLADHDDHIHVGF